MTPYQGNEKYIFVSYAHMDRIQVLPMIEALQIAGFRVCYRADGEDEPLFSVDKRLETSAVVLTFISPNTIDSVNARKEINYVMQNQKDMLVAYLEDINSQYGLGKQLNSWVSLHRSQCPTEVSFLNEILKAPMLQDYKKSGNESVSFVSVKAPIVKSAPASAPQCQVGDIIKFGSYPQNGNVKEEIEWQVLDVKNGQALVISKYALDCQRYNADRKSVTWENCTLRQWLNSHFLNSAFSKLETNMILAVTISADKNPKYGTDPGNTTTDKIFLLSILEAKKYFGRSSARKCKSTMFAKENGTLINYGGNCWWWLRSSGYVQNYVAFINSSGSICEDGNLCYSNKHAVRPAFWLNLDS